MEHSLALLTKTSGIVNIVDRVRSIVEDGDFDCSKLKNSIKHSNRRRFGCISTALLLAPSQRLSVHAPKGLAWIVHLIATHGQRLSWQLRNNLLYTLPCCHLYIRMGAQATCSQHVLKMCCGGASQRNTVCSVPNAHTLNYETQ